jgi:hypothetical protein
VRIIEENFLEIKPIQGNDQLIIVVDSYSVIDRETGQDTFEWKNDRKNSPKLTLKGGRYAYAQENLRKSFREGDKLIFLEINSHTKSLKE